MGFKDQLGKLILVELNDEIYEGILEDYDDEHFIISVDGDMEAYQFETSECTITLSDELIVPDHAAFLTKIIELRRKGFYIIDGGNTKQ